MRKGHINHSTHKLLLQLQTPPVCNIHAVRVELWFVLASVCWVKMCNYISTLNADQTSNEGWWTLQIWKMHIYRLYFGYINQIRNII